MADQWQPPDNEMASSDQGGAWSPPDHELDAPPAPTPQEQTGLERSGSVLPDSQLHAQVKLNTNLQDYTAIPHAAASAAINMAAPIAAALESVITGKPYHEVKQTWADTPDNPRAREVLETASQLPVLKQVGALVQAGGNKLSEVTDGAISPEAATDLINTALLATGAGRAAVLKAGKTATAAEAAAGTPSSAASMWRINPADSIANQYVGNNAWAQQIGLPGAFRLTSNVIRAADDKMDAVYKYIYSPDKNYAIDINATLSGLNKLTDDYTGLAEHATVKKFAQAVRDSTDKTQSLNTGLDVGGAVRVPGAGQMDAEQLGNWATRLGRAAQSTPDFELKTGLFKVKEQIQDLVQQNLSQADKDLFAATNGHYRALHGQLLGSSGNLNVATGHVNLAKMGEFLQNTDKDGYAFGKNASSAYAAARFGQNQTLYNSIPSTTAGAIMKAGMKAGMPMQWLIQRGPANVAKALSSNTAFRTALIAGLKQPMQQGAGDQP